MQEITDEMLNELLEATDGGQSVDNFFEENLKVNDDTILSDSIETETSDNPEVEEDSTVESEKGVAPQNENLDSYTSDSDAVTTHENTDSNVTDTDTDVENEEETSIEEEVVESETVDTQIDVEEYQRLKDFHAKATRKFKARGREFDGFDDPDHIITAQQKALEYDELAKKQAKLRPIEKALEASGLLDDKEKFNLAIEVLDGNVEAIKALLKDKEIDPYDLDLEEIDETAIKSKSHVESDIVLAYDDTIREAEALGVQDTMSEVLESWDTDSVVDLLQDNQYKDRLLEHIETGLYDTIQKEIEFNKRTDDVHGSFSRLNSKEQYRVATQRYYDKTVAASVDKGTENTVEPVAKATNSNKSRVNKADKVSKAKVVTKKVSTKSTRENDVMDFDNMTEEQILEFVNNITKD